MAGFSAKTADFFLLTDLVLFLLPDFLLLVVVVNIHSQTEKDHNGNGNGSYVHTITIMFQMAKATATPNKSPRAFILVISPLRGKAALIL